MGHNKVYGICENKCMVETMSKEQILRRSVLIATGEPPLTSVEELYKNDTTAGVYPDNNFKFKETHWVTNFKSMFSGCSSLTEVSELDTSNGTNFKSMFSSCENLISIPELDTSKATSFETMFNSCKKLISIPDLDTSKATSFRYIFALCLKLTSIPDLDLNNATEEVERFDKMFYGCEKLTTLRDNPFAPEGSRWQFNDTVDFSNCPLNRASILKVFNGLQTVSGKTIYISRTTNNYLSAADKAIATDKGWTVSV